MTLLEAELLLSIQNYSETIKLCGLPQMIHSNTTHLSVFIGYLLGPRPVLCKIVSAENGNTLQESR
uniref:Uncharacterized protein n=1 Tax=Anguilla anguilla TaxID=7936 RepID=A0A0E9WJW6_ANGAN